MVCLDGTRGSAGLILLEHNSGFRDSKTGNWGVGMLARQVECTVVMWRREAGLHFCL